MLTLKTSIEYVDMNVNKLNKDKERFKKCDMHSKSYSFQKQLAVN